MDYSNYSLHDVEKKFGIESHTGNLFETTSNLSAPEWLTEQLLRGKRFPILSGKGRDELIVMPILMACRELAKKPLTVYSGLNLDAKPELGLHGECDFLLGFHKSIFELRAPIAAVIMQAKNQDIVAGESQCVAQMVGIRYFNEAAGTPVPAIYGCVTTGVIWQFIRLTGAKIEIDRKRYYLNEVGRILGVFQRILQESIPVAR